MKYGFHLSLTSMQSVEIPHVVAEDLKRIGGLKSVSENVPERRRLEDTCKIFQSISDSIRLSILYALSKSPLCVCLLKSIVKVPDSKLSYHLANLKSAGLITQQSDGRFIIYKTSDLGKDLIDVCDSLDQ